MNIALIRPLRAQVALAALALGLIFSMGVASAHYFGGKFPHTAGPGCTLATRRPVATRPR